MSCSYSDGWGLYSWHGVAIPEQYYISAPSAKQILAEENIEVRRSLIERHDELSGKGSFFKDAGAKTLDDDVQPMRPGEPSSINELLSIDLPDDPDGRMVAVRVIDPSTGREYFLRVHPELRPMLPNGELGEPQEMTVRNAIASTFGLRGVEYALQQES